MFRLYYSDNQNRWLIHPSKSTKIPAKWSDAGNHCKVYITVFAALVQVRAGALMIAADRFFNTRSQQLAALALRHGVPTIYQNPEFAAAGGLMSYGEAITRSRFVRPVFTSDAFSRARNLPTCRCCCRANLSS